MTSGFKLHICLSGLQMKNSILADCRIYRNISTNVHCTVSNKPEFKKKKKKMMPATSSTVHYRLSTLLYLRRAE